MSYRQTDERFNVRYSVIVHLKQRVNQTGSIKERQWTGRHLKTTPREDRILKRLVRQQPISTANTQQSRWIVNGIVNGCLRVTTYDLRQVTSPIMEVKDILYPTSGDVIGKGDGISK
jgi:transposase